MTVRKNIHGATSHDRQPTRLIVEHMQRDTSAGAAIARAIIGFHQDDEQHWVADLACGHTQHVRHDPPWQNRPWVITESGRAQFLGTSLECVKCVQERGTTHEMLVVTPYRLDLTVSALRRLPSNLVDVYTADGRYLRASNDAGISTITCVTQPHEGMLAVRVVGGSNSEVALARVRRMLGTDRELDPFYKQAAQISWLAPLVHRMRGIKPPRYPSLWEACVNAIVFQQISLHAASSIMRRVIEALGGQTVYDGIPLAVFPDVERFLRAPDATLRAAGLSAGKMSTLQRAARAIVADELNEERLQMQSTADAALSLRTIKGIGPWTAAVILLRGLGRLDAFPGNDSGVAANLALVAGQPLDAAAIAGALGSQRGMLYFCLLLARLESRGEIGKASDVSLK